MRKFPGRPSPAMVVACIALLVALGGTSIAAVTQLVPRNSVGPAQLRNGAVTNPKLRNNAVTSTKVASNAVVAAKIASNAVTGPKIAGNAVTGAKVADGSLAAADLASGVIPPPSNAFGRFVNGPVPVPDALAQVASLSIPNAGNYVITAKAVVEGAGTVTCRLEAGTDTDESAANVAGNNSPLTISNLVLHNFTAAGTVAYRCIRAALLPTDISQIKIAAISVQNLTNSG